MGATDATNYGEADRAVNEPPPSFTVPGEGLLRHIGIFATQSGYNLFGKASLFHIYLPCLN